MTAAERKQELRARLKAQREAMQVNYDDAGAILTHLAELCLSNGATKIACYLAFGKEPDTELFIDWALENDIEVLLPVSHNDGTLSWVKFEGETFAGIFGFPEPAGPAVLPKNVDLAFIPALAVDQNGNRLGKGRGFYDRALKEFDPLPPVVAVIHSHELVDSIEAESHDHPVDAVASPSGVHIFSRRLK